MSDEVKQLSLVICLPFKIRRTDKGNETLEYTRDWIRRTNPIWKESNDPPPADPNAPWPTFQCYQARVYFHPFVRRFLYDPSKVCRLRRSDIKYLSADLKDFSTVLDVRRCELVLFQPDIGVLLLELNNQQPLTLKQTQILMDSLRRVYPPYFGNDESRLHKLKPGEPLPTEINWYSGHCPRQVELRNEKDEQIGEAGNYAGKTPISGTVENPIIPQPEFAQPYLDAVLGSAEQRGSKVLTTPIRYPWAAHWRELLTPFKLDHIGGDEHTLRAEQIGDDRAPIMSWIAVNNPRAISRGDWMRLCFADDEGSDELPYSRQFMREFEENYCYDRYWYIGASVGKPMPDNRSRYEPWFRRKTETPVLESGDKPSRILNCGYAFSFVGNANDEDFFTNFNNGTLPTFRNIYVEMGLIAHFQKAALLSASERLTDMVRRSKCGNNKIEMPKLKEVRNFYNHFIEFTQVFWFHEISPQIQGREIFEKWREHLGIQRLYNEVHKELKDLVEYMELRAGAELNLYLSWFAGISIVLAVLTLVAGVFGMNNLEFGANKIPMGSGLCSLVDPSTCLGWHIFWSFAVPSLLIVAPMIIGLLFLIKKVRRHG